MVKFRTILEGEHCEFQTLRWQRIPLVNKPNSCCRTPQFNVQCIDDVELHSLLADLHEVGKIETYRTHPFNHNIIEQRISDVKCIILLDATIQIDADFKYIEPLITDTIVEYEETDTWLLYFDLARPKVVPYYERLENHEWTAVV